MCVITKGGREYCVYPLDDVMEALGKKWSLLVVGIIGNKPKTRFHEIQTALPDLSPRTLTDRLRELEGLGIVDRRAFPGVPLHVEYTLTEDGEALRDALIPLLEWAARRA
ncbi:MAG: winged helix-turn-helix transcriptional regulator [Methanobacteriota archaeon]